MEQCESHVTLLLAQLREIRRVNFPSSMRGDGLRWPTLLAWLQDTVAQCEADLKRAIRHQNNERAAQLSLPLQEANSLIHFLAKSVPTIPSTSLVRESTLLELRDSTSRASSASSSGDLNTPPSSDRGSSMLTELRRHRARADMADLSTGIYGYKALIMELNELGVISVPENTQISLPDSPGMWLSTLDGLEWKLMTYSREVAGAGGSASASASANAWEIEQEKKVKLGQVIRLRGWILAARKQHAGTTKRGAYYAPEHLLRQGTPDFGEGQAPNGSGSGSGGQRG